MSLAQGNNTPTRPRIEPGSPDPESEALTTRPVRPPLFALSRSLFSVYYDKMDGLIVVYCRFLDGDLYLGVPNTKFALLGHDIKFATSIIN